MDTSTVITIITKIVIPVCSVIITYFVVPWFKEKIGAEKFDRVSAWAWKIVDAAEQIFPAGDNEAKFEYAINFIQAQAKKHGIELTYEEARALIEAAVSNLPKTHTTAE